MTDVFGPTYSSAYDALYEDKDYVSECDLIERIIQTYSGNRNARILDLGCGTGNHSVPLANRGYQVVGVDRSDNMLALARAKADGITGSGTANFFQGDIRQIRLKDTVDVALMMFAVLGYQLDNQDVLAALETVRYHLRPGGIFIFDVWYGPAVLHQRPSQRVKEVDSSGRKFLRVATGDLDTYLQVCTVNYHIWELSEKQIIAETQEAHPVRYFFPQELKLFLSSAQLELIKMGGFPDFDKDPDESTWNVTVVARAI